MKKNINSVILPFMLTIFSGCQGMSGLFKSVEDIATDNAIKIEIQKEAINKETDINMVLQVTNKD